MRVSLTLVGLGLSAIFNLASAPVDSILIDKVGQKYLVQSFSFEVNPQNGRAGILLEYDNPQALMGVEDDGDPGPAPRIRIVPNLKYDPSAHAVVYEEGNKSITCATEAKHWTVLGKITYMRLTGACRVTSRVTNHSWDNGWRIESARFLDTYLEIFPADRP